MNYAFCIVLSFGLDFIRLRNMKVIKPLDSEVLPRGLLFYRLADFVNLRRLLFIIILIIFVRFRF
jgi:hypothetical protein